VDSGSSKNNSSTSRGQVDRIQEYIKMQVLACLNAMTGGYIALLEIVKKGFLSPPN